DCLNQHRLTAPDDAIQLRTAGGSIVNLDRVDPRSSGNRHEIRGIKIAGKLRIAEKDHLLPLNLAKRVVLDDDDLDIQFVSSNRNQFAQQHTQAAVADDAEDRTVRISNCSSDGIGQAARHGGEIAGAAVFLA